MKIIPPSRNDLNEWEVKLIGLPNEDKIDKFQFMTFIEAEKFYNRQCLYANEGAD